VDYKHLFHEYNQAYAKFEQDAGRILTENLQDRSARTGLSLAGWKPGSDHPKKAAVDWYEIDFEYAEPPEQSSHEFLVVSYNTTFYQYSGDDNLVFDERGYSYFIEAEASTFLQQNDPRLMLNTIVTDVAYSDAGVTVHTNNGDCVQAEYAICTFSLGVLQHDVVQFHPQLPEWKRTGIESMTMATYTKIFLQFPPDQIFWDQKTLFYLYADPYERGYYPIWESLDAPGFLEGSGIFFVTVVQDQSYTAEAQTDEQTKEQVMEVLRKMFGAENVPDPIAFMYPRWSLEPWAFGSYSNWPPSYTLEMHQNLRASVGRLWFAGEATSTEYYGYLHGAYFEGQRAGESFAKCIDGNKRACASDGGYEVLHGTTKPGEYSLRNGWTVSSFLTYGF
jgi:polyamine oxidase